MMYGQGQDDIEVSITIKGTTSICRGETGELSVTFNADDDPDPIANALVNDVLVSGAKNGPITTKIQFVPAPPEES
jgi:hypothetical protein